jgi:GH25 family lysozyme M1 (1,4-beta-N-acetylmuramidase)
MNAIDISKHQNTFSAGTAKAAGVHGVILRHAYGTTPDTKAAGWAPDVAANGLRLGGYGFATWHYRSLNGGSATTARRLMIAQVTKWIEMAKSAGTGWWFAIDQELEQGQVMGLGMTANTNLINEAAELLRAAGLQPCLYCSVAWDMQYIKTDLLTVPYWMARYYDGTADFGDACADLDKLPAGSYTNWMKELKQAGRLIGWQFASTGLGYKYGAGSANIDRNVFYSDPEGYRDMAFGPVKPQSQAMHVCLGPVSNGDANTIISKLDELQIDYHSTEQEDGLVLITTKIACSTGDQASLINLAVQLAIPVRLLNSEQAAKIISPVEKPEEKPDEGYSVIFLGLVVKGGFASAAEAKEYIEAVLGANAMESFGISVA